MSEFKCPKFPASEQPAPDKKLLSAWQEAFETQ